MRTAALLLLALAASAVLATAGTDTIFITSTPSVPSTTPSSSTSSTSSSSSSTSVSKACTLCEEAVAVLETYAANKTLDSALLDDAENYCYYFNFSSDLESECHEYLVEYGPLLISLLSGGVAPESVCSIFQLCSDTGLCTVCSLAVNLVESLDLSSTIEYDILDLAYGACGDIPYYDNKTECIEEIKAFGPLLIQELQNGTSGAAVCASVGVCAPSTSTSSSSAVTAEARKEYIATITSLVRVALAIRGAGARVGPVAIPIVA